MSNEQKAKRTGVRLTFGRDITEADLKKLQIDTNALEAKLSEGDHEHHSDHSGATALAKEQPITRQ